MKLTIFILCSVLLNFNTTFAQEKKTTVTQPANVQKVADVEAKDIRCEKHTGTGLADFKDALVENCNLNKPFSTSLSRMLNDEVYFYCCHKKTASQ